MSELHHLANALGEQVSERLQEPIHRVDLPAHESGDVPHVGLGVTRGEDLRIFAVVSGQDGAGSVAWIEERAGITSLMAAHTQTGDASSTLAHRVAASVAAETFDRVGVNALDVGVGLVQGFSHTLTATGSWFRLSIQAKWEESTGTSGTYVDVAGAEQWVCFAWIAQGPTGVTVSLPAYEIEGPRGKWELSTPAELRAAFQAIAMHVKRAVDARAVWRARAFTGQVAGERIIDSFAATGVVRGALRLSAARGDRFPLREPVGCVFRKDEIGDHVCVYLEEMADGVTISAGRLSFVAKNMAELDAFLPDLASAASEEQARLTPDKLVPGAHYRVRQDLPGAPQGTLLRFERREHVRYDGFDIHHFTAADEDRAVALYDVDRAATAPLRRLDEFLEEVAET